MQRKVLLITFAVLLVAALAGFYTMAWFTAKADAPENEFTAGTVMLEAETTYLYGVEYEGENAIYEIYIDREEDKVTYSKLFETGYHDTNALAHDNDNNRLYYTAKDLYELYFYCLDSGEGNYFAGDLEDELDMDLPKKNIYGAAYGLGAYWFIFEKTDDLYRITFNEDGTIDEDDSGLYAQNITGEIEHGFQFGDVALELRDGILYGSTHTDPELFFTYNIRTGEYDEPDGADAKKLQLGYGGDGVLYGHETRRNTWYEVNPESGVKTLFYTDTHGVQFSDLACSYQSNWNPGDCEVVRYRLTNTGSKNSYLRLDLETVWELNQEYLEAHWEKLCLSESYGSYTDLLKAVDTGLGPVEITFCEGTEDDWIDDNGSYLYRHEVAPGDQVSLCLVICLEGEGTGNAYQGATYTLEATGHAIQSSNNAIDYVDGWEALR